MKPWQCVRKSIEGQICSAPGRMGWRSHEKSRRNRCVEKHKRTGHAGPGLCLSSWVHSPPKRWPASRHPASHTEISATAVKFRVSEFPTRPNLRCIWLLLIGTSLFSSSSHDRRVQNFASKGAKFRKNLHLSGAKFYKKSLLSDHV